MNMSRTTFFFMGLVLGILATVFLPSVLRPYLPQWVMGKSVVVTGKVVAKQKKPDVLLLTVDTLDGALLATFKRKVDEINLLVSEKDRIEISIPKYSPFVDDPKIVRVVKEPQSAVGTTPAPEKPAVPEAKEEKPKKHDRPAAPAPATGATGTNPPAVSAHP